jgi:mannose/fructose/N-acetylgalactosamine-specific phosphotransferase system component IIB
VTVLLARVDERLIHGQVSVGWVPALDVERILVADDAAAADAWERDLLVSSGPPGAGVDVRRIDDAARELAEGVPDRVLLLVRSPALALALLRAGAPLPALNLGGLHYRRGARRLLDYLYLTREDIDALRALAAGGVRLVARDLPGAREVDLGAMVKEGILEYDRLPPGPS